MKLTATNRAISIAVFTLIAFNGLFLFGNELFMLTVPRAWYYFVPWGIRPSRRRLSRRHARDPRADRSMRHPAPTRNARMSPRQTS
jgi:hypothetical protein